MKEGVLVTGGAGFVGSHLTRSLADRGYSVTVLDDLSRGKIAYLVDLIKSDRIRFIKGDIRDADLVRDATKGVSYIFHKAAVCINYSVADPVTSFEINMLGTYNVFRAAHEEKVKKVVFASSASVYGNPDYVPMDEQHPLKPITPYCISKIAGENMLRMKGLDNIRHLTYRYFNIYGLKQSTDAYYTSVIISFVKRAHAGLSPRIIGDGGQSMDFVNVADVVDVDISGIESDVEGEIINIGSGKSTSIKELAHVILKQMGKDLAPEYVEGPRPIVQRRQANIEKARRLLGFSPKIDLQTGLSQLIDDITRNPGDY